MGQVDRGSVDREKGGSVTEDRSECCLEAGVDRGEDRRGTPEAAERLHHIGE
jgi:hypothetical protein